MLTGSSLTCRMVSPVSCGARLSSCSPDRERLPSDHIPRRSATHTHKHTHTFQALSTMPADLVLTNCFCCFPGIPSDQLHTHPTLPQSQDGHLNSLTGRVPHSHQPYKHQTVEVHTTRHSYHCEGVKVRVQGYEGCEVCEARSLVAGPYLGVPSFPSHWPHSQSDLAVCLSG